MKSSIISDQVSMDFEEALQRIHEQFEYVEIHSLWNKTVEDLSDSEAGKVEALIGKYRVKVSCLSTTLFLMCPLFGDVASLKKFSDDFLVFTGDAVEHTERLRRCLELAGRFGTQYIRIFPFRLEGEDSGEFEELLMRMKESLSTALSLAEKDGKTLLLENCPHSYLPRGNMTHELSSSMGSRNLMLLYDIGNSFTSERQQVPDRFGSVPLTDEYEAIKSRIRHFHFKDYRKTGHGFRHVAFGAGDMDYADLSNRIKRDNLHAVVSLESEVRKRDVKKSISNFLEMV